MPDKQYACRNMLCAITGFHTPQCKAAQTAKEEIFDAQSVLQYAAARAQAAAHRIAAEAIRCAQRQERSDMRWTEFDDVTGDDPQC